MGVWVCVCVCVCFKMTYFLCIILVSSNSWDQPLFRVLNDAVLDFRFGQEQGLGSATFLRVLTHFWMITLLAAGFGTRYVLRVLNDAVWDDPFRQLRDLGHAM